MRLWRHSGRRIWTRSEEFQKLRDWVPHFYLNRSDLICVRFITYYEEQQVAATRHNIDISEQAIITRFFGGNANYITNVVPSANLYISKKYEGRRLKAHSLKQWHKFTNENIQLQESQARLVAGYKHHFAQRAARYAGHKLHDLGRNVLAKTVRHGTS